MLALFSSSFLLLLALVRIDLLFGEASLDVVDQVAVNKRPEPGFFKRRAESVDVVSYLPDLLGHFPRRIENGI